MEEEGLIGNPMGEAVPDPATIPAPAPAAPVDTSDLMKGVTALSRESRGVAQEPVTNSPAGEANSDTSPKSTFLDYFKSAVDSIPESEDFMPKDASGRTLSGGKSTQFLYDSTVGTLKSGLQSAIAVYEAHDKGEVDWKNLANLGFATASFVPIAGPEMRALSAMKSGASKIGQVASSIVGGSKAELGDLASWAERSVTKAEGMAATGATENEIYRTTGLSRDERGNFQFEVSDKNMGMNPKFAENFSNTIGALQKMPEGASKEVSGKFSDFFSHPQLEAIHPELKNAPVTFRMKSGEGSIGAAVTDKTLGFEFDVPASLKAGAGANPENTLKGVVAHELQHYVDMRAAETGMFRSIGTNSENARRYANQAVSDLASNSGSKELGTRVQRVFNKMEETYQSNPEWTKSYREAVTNDALYRHEAGEVRARTTGRSIEMTMEERLNTHPNQRADVAPENQISFGDMTRHFQEYRSMLAQEAKPQAAPSFGRRGK
jgi:hypothetical protein